MSTAEIKEIFTSHLAAAEVMAAEAARGVQLAFSAYSNAGNYRYEPYEWQVGSPPYIAYSPSYIEPAKPALGALPAEPQLKDYPEIPSIDVSGKPVLRATKPSYRWPAQPGGPPSDQTGNMPQRHEVHFPSQPVLYPLPAATLPYLTVNLPDKPVWENPVLNACPPGDIATIPLEEYLQKLADAYAEYSDSIPRLVLSNWLMWYQAMLGEHPLLPKIEQILSTYYDNGGAGIPVPIEEAIVTRATDRVTAEYRRAHATVYEGAARRGLLLPSGALLAGHKEARQVAAEAVSKVVTDVAIKNLELEHDYMKFMLQLGLDFEKTLLGFAGDLAKTVTEINGQAIEMTKHVLTGMLAVNEMIIKIYLAKWEGYKAAVEAYKAEWMAVEVQIRVYEAEIKAELAKIEIDKAYVDVLTAMVGANTALVNLYKATIDAETAKLEADRVAIQGYQAAVQAYVAKVEAYKAQWQGFSAATEGQVALAKAYEAEVQAYAAEVNGYKAGIEGQAEAVRAKATHVEAIAKENEGQLKAWQIKLDGQVKAYTGQMEGYRAEWQAVSEKLRGYAEGARIMGDFLTRMYTQTTQIDIERAHQHLAEWRGSMEAAINSAKGVTEAANVAAHVAASALNGLTAIAGVLAASEE